MMTRKFDLEQVTPVRGDCTSGYNVRLHGKVTVEEFVQEVLKRDDWGDIHIFDKYAPNNWYMRRDCCCTYWHGTLKTRFPDDILKKTIASASADGGWSLMDYVLTLEEDEKHSESENKDSDITLYLCNPLANISCGKNQCFLKEGESCFCFKTSKKEFAARDADGNPIVLPKKG